MNVLSHFKESNLRVFILTIGRQFHQLKHKINIMGKFMSGSSDSSQNQMLTQIEIKLEKIR